MALVADIEKEFLSVGIQESDRDALRFLWVDEVMKENPKLVEIRFTRVFFGIISSN